VAVGLGPAVSAVAALLPGDRLHLQHGPIDIIARAWGDADAIERAYRAAWAAFSGLLEGLCADLTLLRRPLPAPRPHGPVARRMHDAALPFCAGAFVTPMAAVAGAVADHILAEMRAAAPLARAFVNNGGDIALHLAPGRSFRCGIVSDLASPGLDAIAAIAAEHRVRGIATSGRATKGSGGRSFSLGIADAVTVLAEDAATADVAATLVANAVDLPGHPAVHRVPACALDPDSDLGSCPVTVGLGPLAAGEIAAALDRGVVEAERFRSRGLIAAAILFLRGQRRIVGPAPLVHAA